MCYLERSGMIEENERICEGMDVKVIKSGRGRKCRYNEQAGDSTYVPRQV